MKNVSVEAPTVCIILSQVPSLGKFRFPETRTMQRPKKLLDQVRACPELAEGMRFSSWATTSNSACSKILIVSPTFRSCSSGMTLSAEGLPW